nr:sugar ABC transporter substrate-binding protein [Maliibacterium massiliense]
MKKTVKCICMLLALALTLSLAACSPAKATPSAAEGQTSQREGYSIGYIVKSMSLPFFVEMEKGIRSYMEEKGTGQDQLITLDSNKDLTKELSNVEDLVSQKADAILLATYDYEGSCASVDIANAASVPIILVDNPSKNADSASAVVTSDNRTAGALAMENLCEGMGGKGNLVIFQESTNTAGRARYEGAIEALKKYPDINVIVDQDGTAGVDNAMKIFDDVMSANKDIDGVWVYSDNPAQGVVAAIEAAGRTGDIQVAAIDGSAFNLDLIQKGQQFGTSLQFPYRMGYMAAEIAYGLIEGRAPAQQRTELGVEWVDAANVEQYL